MQEKWQKDLTEVIKSSDKLAESLNIGITTPAILNKSKFKLKAPKNFIQNIENGNINDPLLKQILPLTEENIVNSAFTASPLFEEKFIKIPGLIHKYKSRVLLIISGGCAINCRYCFRKEFPYGKNVLNLDRLNDIRSYIENDKNITEVIFSGGDPLIATDQHLNKISSVLEEIEHLKSLRIHSRIPIVMPSRISEGFLNWITNLKLKPVIVVHCNHPNEINSEVINASNILRKNGVLLLNQSVLLKGVNDNPQVLKALSEKLFFQANILPYYLHILDKVQGTQHFEVDLNKAKAIYSEIQKLLPGYLVPKFATEIPGKDSKTLING